MAVAGEKHGPGSATAMFEGVQEAVTEGSMGQPSVTKQSHEAKRTARTKLSFVL